MRAAERLRSLGIQFEELPGLHLVIHHAGTKIDFWPVRGQWVDRRKRRPRVGVRALIKELSCRTTAATHCDGTEK